MRKNLKKIVYIRVWSRARNGIQFLYPNRAYDQVCDRVRSQVLYPILDQIARRIRYQIEDHIREDSHA